MVTEPYDENLLAHQEPIVGVSEWQEWNDANGGLAQAIASYDPSGYDLNADQWRKECQILNRDFTIDPDELR